MAKINFTKEHFDKMKNLAVEMLFNNDSVVTKMGQVLNISDLLHLTSISTLNTIRLSITRKIEEAENKDEWVSTDEDSKKLNTLRKQKELINLIIGYKRYNLEQETIKSERKKLEDQLKNLEESQKSPEDKIKELKEKIAKLDETVF